MVYNWFVYDSSTPKSPGHTILTKDKYLEHMFTNLTKSIAWPLLLQNNCDIVMTSQ